MFKKATKEAVFLKLGITGPTGAGKTFSALRMARGLVGPKGRIAVVDTENGSASLYSDKFEFDVLNIAPPFEPSKFAEAIRGAAEAGYDVVIVDSMSHAWEGTLEFKSKLDARPGANSYTNWAQAGDKWKEQLSAALQSPIHVLACLRSKMEYVLETNEKGKTAPRKVGLAPIARDGTEYEFTTVFDIDVSHNAATSKDRTGLFGDRIFQITEDTGRMLDAWRKNAPVINEVHSTKTESTPTPAAHAAPAAPTSEHATKEQLDKLAYYVKATNKTLEAVVKAALWASNGRASDFISLTEAEADKVIVEFQKQMNKTAEKPVSAPEPSADFKAPESVPVEDVPFFFEGDLAFLNDRLPVALSYLRKIGWLGESAELAQLPPERIQQIVSKRPNFERALTSHAEEMKAHA